MTISEKERSEIRSLLSLIDDDDASVYQTVRQRLIEHGAATLDALPSGDSPESSAGTRIAEIRNIITRTIFKPEFKSLRRPEAGDIDLEEGAFLIARHRYPSLNTAPYVEMLNRHAYELREKLSSVADNDEIVHRTIAYFANEQRFTGNQQEYYKEDNHYLHRVLETKTGIPISLSAVYLLVAKRINLPVVGIGLPGHFILAFSFPEMKYFFDPFNDGKILHRRECEEMVHQLGFTFTEEYLQPVSNRQIVERMLRNIILSLEKRNEKDRIETIRSFIDTLNSDV